MNIMKEAHEEIERDKYRCRVFDYLRLHKQNMENTGRGARIRLDPEDLDLLLEVIDYYEKGHGNK